MNRYYKFLIRSLSLCALFGRTSCGPGYLLYGQKQERGARLHSSDLMMSQDSSSDCVAGTSAFCNLSPTGMGLEEFISNTD